MILFVCTGNTCRSPLAEALTRAAGIDAASAGLYAFPGEPATAQAIRAAAAWGGDLTHHKARTVDEEMMAEAAQVFAMTPSHAAELARRFPSHAEKIRALSIPDPYGGGDEVYAQCAAAIRDALHRAGLL